MNETPAPDHRRRPAGGSLRLGRPLQRAEPIYYSVGGERSDSDLQAAAQVCDAQEGVVKIGQDTSDAYKHCMMARGWEYASTTRSLDKSPYPDPRHPGRTCHDFVIFGVIGSSCSNF